MSQYIHSPNEGGGVDTYVNFAAFPATAADGMLGIALDTGALYEFRIGSMTWVLIASPGGVGVTAVGALDTGAPSADGAHIAGNAIIFQSASATMPGLVNNTTQTMSGAKTFDTAILTPALTVDYIKKSDDTIVLDTTVSGIAVVISSDPKDEVKLAVVGATGQTSDIFRVLGSVGEHLLTVTAAGDLRLNGIVRPISAGAAFPLALLTPAATATGAISLTTGNASAGNSGDISLTTGTATGVRGSVNISAFALAVTGAITATGTVTGTNISGTNTGDVTLTAVGSTPNANGASLSGQALTLQPADGTNPGVLTAGTQTIGGNKVFTGTISSPQALRSERFGALSSANAVDSTAIGNTAVADQTLCVAIGSGADCIGASAVAIGYDSSATTNSIAVGRGAMASASSTTAVGYGTISSAVRSFAVGSSATGTADAAHAIGNGATAGHQAAICIGYNSTSTAANQLIIGGATRGIYSAFIGDGVTHTAPNATLTLNATGGSGTDIVASNFVIASGRGTGAAAVSSIIFQTPTLGSTGTTAQTLVQRAQINSTALTLATGFAPSRVTTAISYAALAGNTIIGVTDNSAQRTVTLMAASAVPSGYILIIKDEAGTAGSANNIIVARAGADTIDGATSINITVDYGCLRLYSDGSSKWFSI